MNKSIPIRFFNLLLAVLLLAVCFIALPMRTADSVINRDIKREPPSYLQSLWLPAGRQPFSGGKNAVWMPGNRPANVQQSDSVAVFKLSRDIRFKSALMGLSLNKYPEPDHPEVWGESKASVDPGAEQFIRQAMDDLYFQVDGETLLVESSTYSGPAKVSKLEDGRVSIAFRWQTQNASGSFYGIINEGRITVRYEASWSAVTMHLGRGENVSAEFTAPLVRLSQSDLPPRAPTNVTVRELRDRGLLVTWKDTANTDIQGYVVFRCIVGSGGYQMVGRVSRYSYEDHSPEVVNEKFAAVLYYVVAINRSGAASRASQVGQIILAHRAYQF